MRISDWSSDVCSSDLAATSQGSAAQAQRRNRHRHADRHSQDVEGGRGYRSWETLRVRCRAACENIRSEEHTSELQSLMRISYAVFCLKKKTYNKTDTI